MLAIEFTAVTNEAADELVRHSDQFLNQEPAPNGLLSYRVVRHGEHTTRIVIFEEWTDISMQEALIARPEFGRLMQTIAPLLAEPGRANTYDVLTAGPRAGSSADAGSELR